MFINHLDRQFARIGARVKLHAEQRAGFAIDIRRDDDGEFFDVAVSRNAAPDLAVLDVQPRQRHLLLLNREGDQKHKFLCGHDERHWFVAAIPERGAASTVQTAMEALKPAGVRWRQDQQLRVKSRHRNLRRNAAFIRQGEWFFVPAIGFRPLAAIILRDEPLRRGNGKPHIVEELVRSGGETVYVSVQHPAGLTPAQHRSLLSRQPKLRNLQWVVQRRNPQVFVRGRVRHADHKTIVLHDWHQVLLNTEHESRAMRHVAFID